MFIFNYSTIVDPLLRDSRVQTTKLSGMKAGDRALDVCCATGAQVFHYAKGGIIPTGIDANPRMIKIANKNKRKQGLRNVSFQIANAENLPFKDNFFDCASISFALHENERTMRDKMISEMKRVVKKGSTLIFMDFRVPLPKGRYFYFIKAIEFMVGRDNYRCFKDYIEEGGLDGILKNNRLTEEKRDDMNNKILVIIKTRNVERDD